MDVQGWGVACGWSTVSKPTNCALHEGFEATNYMLVDSGRQVTPGPLLGDISCFLSKCKRQIFPQLSFCSQPTFLVSLIVTTVLYQKYPRT